MTIKKNAWIVMDTETSAHDGLVFDFGWTTIDKHGNILGKGDLNFLDVIVKEKPYYVHKIGGYATRQRRAFTRSLHSKLERVFSICTLPI